ncbi:MAG: asparagine synthase (glutamine-hydrolyzing) [Patescibacteria group bacterium]
MCGFAGFVGAQDPELLRRMGQAVRHRGPDQEGDFESDPCSFSHKRLSIIDLTEAGRQPLASEDGRFVVAYNGEIYNYKELRVKYEKAGWKFRTQTDTECLLASASLHGLTDLGEFHGMFAFALWDRELGTCFLARDRMGIKPLFVAEIDGRVGFASEVGGLLPMRDAWREDEIARSMYLAVGYVPGPRTIFEGMRNLEPGRLYSIRGPAPYGAGRSGSIHEGPRFDVWPKRDTPRSRAEAEEMLREIVDGAVAAQTVSDRPVGAFLSGGLDSSVVLSAMRIHDPRGTIKTFTTRFKHHVDDPKFNVDADLARRTAERYGCEHYEIEVGAEDVIANAEAMALHLGQPHNNSATVAVDAAARLASKHVPVVLTGDGGDELFGGYRRYQLWSMAGPRITYHVTRSIVRVGAKFHPRYQDWKDLLDAEDEASRLLTFHALPADRRRALFGDATDDAAVLERWRELLVGVKGGDPVSRFMALDRLTWLRDDAFVRSDRLTMRHGVEARVPLLDDSLISFANGLPRSWLVNARHSKILWRSAFADRCLPEVVHGEKRGWITPAAKWIRVGLKDWMEELIEEAIRDQVWIDGPAVRQAFKDHLSGKRYGLIELWTIAQYQLWRRAYRSHLR